jgi:hypothetical protein
MGYNRNAVKEFCGLNLYSAFVYAPRRKYNNGKIPTNSSGWKWLAKKMKNSPVEKTALLVKIVTGSRIR